MSTPGVTYICSENSATNENVAMVCHYNDGSLMHHIEDGSPSFDYYGYIQDPSQSQPNDDKPLYIFKDGQSRSIEEIYCEALLRPGHAEPNPNSPAIFVRFMINPNAAALDYQTKEGFGFPVGWAVRGYTPSELTRRNLKRQIPLQNEMHVLPVFRADFANLAAHGPKSVAAGIQPVEHRKLLRMYYITNQPSYQLLKPKSLELQIKEAEVSPVPETDSDNPDDIASARQLVLTLDPPKKLDPLPSEKEGW